VPADTLSSALRESVEQGEERLTRTLPGLLATGFVGGVDVSVGVVAYLLLLDETGSLVLASLGFSFGFVALTMAGSELFTENFLLPIAALAARKARPRQVARLWAGTAVANLVGGLVVMVLVTYAFPALTDTAIAAGDEFVQRGIGSRGFASAVLAGIVITLMTWMQSGTKLIGGRLVAAVGAGFLLAFGHLSHVVVASLKIFAGALAGAPYGVGEWFGMFWLWAAGNAIGGIGLVTIIRLVQVGPERIATEQRRERPGQAGAPDERGATDDTQPACH
jgi:formate-nitrite transporter family protein